jgi:hypothetical protein
MTYQYQGVTYINREALIKAIAEKLKAEGRIR